MTVSSSLSTQTFNCNGSTTVFTCPFRVLEASELVGYLITIATNESTPLVNGTDFAATGVGAANAVATTTLTYSSAYQVNFRRRTQRLQSTDYRDNDPFPAESHENALDRLTHIAQENDTDISRALLAPEPETGITLPAADVRAGLLLGFGASGEPVVVAPASGSAAALALDLASTANGDGASRVAIEDAGNYFSGANAEAALQQLAPGVFQTPWYITKDSPVLLSLRHATSGNIVQQWQDGSPGSATYFYRGLSIQTDSHSIQMGPATNGGACDLLWQRSTANADPAGNRFNLTFEEGADRLLMSYATTASGAPSFDSWAQIVAGTSPALSFPGLAGQFNQGVGVKQRPAGGFECRLVPTSSTVADLRQIGGSNTIHIRMADGTLGFLGSSGTGRVTLPAAATDAATAVTLVNAIRTMLINFGLAQ